MWTKEKIKKAFSGRLIGNRQMRKHVCASMKVLPSHIISYVTRNVWFVSSPDDAWALTFRGSDLKNQHLVVFADDLFSENDRKIRYTILHEIGHVLLKHRNSMGFLQSAGEVNRQETEADIFAKTFLQNKAKQL